MPYLKSSLPTVALIGRTNVGKSTLFNRLTEKQLTLVSAIPGTTRDRRFGECSWDEKTINLIDTAGLDVEGEKEIDKQAVEMAKKSITEADMILFVVDGRVGILPQDREYAKMILKTKKPVVVAVNKVDSQKQMHGLADFYRLGFKNIEAVSAKSGSGTGELLDLILSLLPKSSSTSVPAEETAPEIKIAIIGKPNVGKSSLFNQIAGEYKSIVSDIPHTTRDSQDVSMYYSPENQTELATPYLLTFIDTAGIIKSRKINDRLKEISIEQSFKSIERSDLVILLVDASEPITMQDKNLATEIVERNKSLIFVVNKWDKLKDKTTSSDKKYAQFLYGHFPFLTWAPIVFTSAKTGAKTNRLLDLVCDVYARQHQKIDQGQLNELLQYILKKKRPPRTLGQKPPYIFKMKQTSMAPLTFEVIAGEADQINYVYRRYLQHEIRKRFGYDGCGVKIVLTEK
jgi:GTP-binding protein